MAVGSIEGERRVGRGRDSGGEMTLVGAMRAWCAGGVGGGWGRDVGAVVRERVKWFL